MDTARVTGGVDATTLTGYLACLAATGVRQQLLSDNSSRATQAATSPAARRNPAASRLRRSNSGTPGGGATSGSGISTDSGRAVGRPRRNKRGRAGSSSGPARLRGATAVKAAAARPRRSRSGLVPNEDSNAAQIGERCRHRPGRYVTLSDSGRRQPWHCHEAPR
jgi:hypothetical protein